ncbi:signal peptidase I [Solimicrobium silvestre]|uniref:Signal peptidase I n=1 Tax=Solimicrobium silvestre TaxID=2099400 RepID=A0A2S9GVR7_9BURK|nr:signal peptidase I [Solimicrobium silvestre]PRC91800.1 Signal peptidase I [Solimicrobium silvestre]
MLNFKKLVLNNKGFIAFMLGMLLFRSAVADWYVVPTSSMYPTLLIGDRVVADRLAYDVKLPFSDVILKHNADPVRGDIVTFSSPADGVRLVKRLVAVPGDVVEMRDDKLIINGQPLSYQAVATKVELTPEYVGQQLVFNENLLGKNHQIIQMPERQAIRSFGPVVVPEGQYLMLGDNRDNSADSRYIGFVKRELITGQVKRVLFSLDSGDYYLPRMNRIASGV